MELSATNPRKNIATLKQFAGYFLKLGYSGFGGPVALVTYIYRDLVERRKWITEEEYNEGMALAQLSPGPLAAQLGIYLGYIHYGIRGATLTILAFIAPSFFMVLLLGIAYKLFGGLPWMQAIFYGISSAVVGIILASAIKLTLKSIGKFTLESFRMKWLLWLIFLISLVFTFYFPAQGPILYLIAGLTYMAIKSPPKWMRNMKTNLVLLGGIGFWQFETGTLWKIAYFFSNAGAFVFGSGLAIVPFLHAGVVIQHNWLNEQQFLDAVAIAMITPGPLIMTVGFIGYLVAGFPGAVVAAVATFLPCYLITIITAPFFRKLASNPSIKIFVEGITASILGSLFAAAILISIRSIGDIQSGVIAICSLLLLYNFKKLKEPYIILGAALIGLLLKM